MNGDVRGLKGETSTLGHEQTSRNVRVMSVIPLKADIHQRSVHVRLVQKRSSSASVRPYW